MAEACYNAAVRSCGWNAQALQV